MPRIISGLWTREEVGRLGLAGGVGAPPRVGRRADHVLGERVRLREPEPVVVAERKRHVRALEVLERGDDVHDAELLDAPGMVEREPVGDARPAVVRRDGEAPVAEMRHQLREVPRHLALGVGRVVRRRRRLERAAVAAQVGAVDGVRLRQRRRDPVPHRVRLRVAVQQQQRRAFAAAPQAQHAAGDLDALERESGEEHAGHYG
jgi:hypothetical protein